MKNRKEELNVHTLMATLVRKQNTRTWRRFEKALHANKPMSTRDTNTWMASLKTVRNNGLGAKSGAAVTIAARQTDRTIHTFMNAVRLCRAQGRAIVESLSMPSSCS